ncbi:hypothetical protein CDL12_18097 [Handroanthus impetiginosus]|uniref:Uncharacterized protein n=1 Tax=Handroanthus impetiginosus TaxID=429701 RepID=A0A2G9GWE1_9LAMI|nr:hypothetical protein CDL12_18097 [Handroanthus impetiginosus]
MASLIVFIRSVVVIYEPFSNLALNLDCDYATFARNFVSLEVTYSTYLYEEFDSSGWN